MGSKREGVKVAIENEELDKRHKALRTSIKEGASASVMSGLGDNYMSAFMVSLTSNPIPISLLSSLHGILSPLSQMAGSRAMEKYSRKKIVTRFVFLHSLMWLPIAIIGLLFWKGIFTGALPYLLLISYSLLAIVSGFPGPAWFSWMGDLVPEKERGRYFSKRNRIAASVTVTSFLIGAFILDLFETKGIVTLGFALLFCIASIARMVSFTFFNKQYEPKFNLDKSYYFTFWAFMKRYGNFTKFAVYQSVFNFAIMIGSPFFAVYMLKNLQFNYLTYTLVSVSSTAFYLLFLPLSGKFSDRYGNIRLITIGSMLYSLYPFLWLFSGNPVYLIFVPQLVVGIASSAFTIATSNFIYDAVTPQRRGICIAYMNVLIGVGILVGGLTGGLILKYVSISFMEPILFVLLLSSIARFSVSLLLLPQVKEVRQVEDVPPLMSTLSTLPKLITGGGLGLVDSIQQSLLTRLIFTKNGVKKRK